MARFARTEAPLTKRALITGITGQDGSYLAEYLLAQGYEVWGLVRGQSNPRVRGVRQLLGDIRLVRGDLLDQGSLISAVERVAAGRGLQPGRDLLRADVLAAGRADRRGDRPGRAAGAGGDPGVQRDQRARAPRGGGQIRFYQASSSEMFGKVRESPQTERTPFHPRSPYGVAKAYGHFLTQNYRESYGMFAVSGILFNHESPRRGARVRQPQGVPRRGQDQAGPRSGSCGWARLWARRDWGFAGDYVRAMHLMLGQDEPEDYVVGTGVTHSVEELVEPGVRRGRPGLAGARHGGRGVRPPGRGGPAVREPGQGGASGSAGSRRSASTS